MKHKIVLFIKTYSQDINACEKLLQSIQKFNKDGIPVIISVNDEDLSLFQEKFSIYKADIIKDSDIIKCNIENAWKYQQVVKSQLHRLDITENYVCLDSDSFFIKDFIVEDFIVEDNIPYTIMHQQKELFSWLSINRKHFKDCPKDYFEQICRKIMSQIGRKGIYYDYGPSPTIWSCKVWESFEESFLNKNNIDYQKLISDFPSEFTWYGEWLLHSREIPLFPKEPLFKVFHYRKQYEDFVKEGHTIDSIKENYLGIVMQSNWMKHQKWYHRKIKW
jgi:hypothetical protein